MNVSTAGIGVNNNNLNGVTAGIDSADESFVVNPEEDFDKAKVFIDNSVGGYNPATEELYYTVYFTNGTVSNPTKVLAADLDPAPKGQQSFDIDGGALQIEAIQLTMGLGVVKIPVIQFITEQVFDPDPLALTFTATLTDGDNDFRTDTFSVSVL